MPVIFSSIGSRTSSSTLNYVGVINGAYTEMERDIRLHRWASPDMALGGFRSVEACGRSLWSVEN